MKSLGQTVDLDREHEFIGFLTDSDVSAYATSQARIAGEEYAKARTCIARRHERTYEPTARPAGERWHAIACWRFATGGRKPPCALSSY